MMEKEKVLLTQPKEVIETAYDLIEFYDDKAEEKAKEIALNYHNDICALKIYDQKKVNLWHKTKMFYLSVAYTISKLI